MVQKKTTTKGRKRYPAEFKADAVKLAQAKGASVREVAKNLGIAEQTLPAWMRSQSGTIDGQEAQDTIVRLQTENRQLKMERDILKKSLGLFVRET